MPIEIKELKISFNVKENGTKPQSEQMSSSISVDKIIEEVTERVINSLERKRDER